VCFQPALGDRTNEESCGRLMEMLFKSVLSRECSSEKLGSRDGDAGGMKGIQRVGYLRMGVGEKGVCVRRMAEVIF
jgi:hypothetical protein